MISEHTPLQRLAPDTIRNYRSTLRRSAIRLNDPTLTDLERNHLKRLVAKLERQLGITARQVRPPGRPRKKLSMVVVPDYRPSSCPTDEESAFSFHDGGVTVEQSV
jgi:hypothetical protein